MKYIILSILSDLAYCFLPMLSYMALILVIVILFAYAFLTSNILLYLVIALILWQVIKYMNKY